MAKTKEQEVGSVVLGEKTEQMIRELQERVESADDGRSPAQIAMDIVEQILTAPTLEEAAGSTADIPIDVPLTLSLRAWQASDIGTYGVFAVLEAVDGFDLENKKVITCGGNNVIPVLYRAEKEGRFPFKGLFREVETRSGYKTLWLDLLPD